MRHARVRTSKLSDAGPVLESESQCRAVSSFLFPMVSKYTSHIPLLSSPSPLKMTTYFQSMSSILSRSLLHIQRIDIFQGMCRQVVAFHFEDPRTCPPAKSLHLLTSLGTSPSFRRGIFSLIARAKRSAV